MLHAAPPATESRSGELVPRMRLRGQRGLWSASADHWTSRSRMHGRPTVRPRLRRPATRRPPRSFACARAGIRPQASARASVGRCSSHAARSASVGAGSSTAAAIVARTLFEVESICIPLREPVRLGLIGARPWPARSRETRLLLPPAMTCPRGPTLMSANCVTVTERSPTCLSCATPSPAGPIRCSRSCGKLRAEVRSYVVA